MRLLFAATLFLSAALLFLVQPMVARMVLPPLGGTPSVWNTCMVFFQAVLLAGYAYAHATTSRLGARRQALLHLALLALPFLVLPIRVTADGAPLLDSSPVLGLLGLLLVAVGLPAFLVATSGPLLQKWFADTPDPAARDPYFLYAASNLGSMLALLGYPLLLEPALNLAGQSRLWTAGYVVLAVLIAGCAVLLRRAPRPKERARPAEAGGGPAPTARARARWVLLAFAPSSLMLSVTTYLTTDIGAIPLLWVLPLALYLLSFILVFLRRPPLPHAVMARWMPLVVLLIVLALLSEATEPLVLLMGLHLLGLFWAAMVCHGELARSRPPASHLTEFYLWLSAGGVLGGVFNALLAPLVFSGVVEYPLVLVLACLLRPAPAAGSQGPDRVRAGDLVLPLALGALTAALVFGTRAYGPGPGPLRSGLMFGLPVVVCYTFLERPVRFGLGVGALLLAASLAPGVYGRAEYRLRSFFGVHRVTLDPTGSYRLLVHGNTVHGQQSLDPARRGEPLTYYHRTGPIGRLFAALEGDPRLERVGLVGLGVGALACYARPGQHWTYYEIDPAVIFLARDSGYFTFLKDTPARLDIVPGDARSTLARSPDRYGLIVVDAFNSDAIPVHLLTREALQVYRSRLAGDGILAFNISNRYLDLQPVLAGLAADARPPMLCLVREDLNVSASEKQAGKAPSLWVVLANRRADVAKLAGGPWRPTAARPGTPTWTDDYANPLGALKWE